MIEEDKDKTQTMTRADIAEAVLGAVPVARHDANEMVLGVMDIISESLAKGEDVKITLFGTFEVQKKKARMGRNPMTGVPASIAERSVVSFRPSNVLRKTVAAGDV